MATEAPISSLRLLLRIANAFTLDLLKIYSRGRDFTDALILAAVVQSLAARVAGDPEQQRRYATFESPIPHELRRPISVNAIATSLNLPFETVRRRVKALIADGLCEPSPDGVLLAQGIYASADALESVYRMVQALYLRLQAADCVGVLDLPPPRGFYPVGSEPPVRIVWRATGEYFLRFMELMLPGFNNLPQAVIIMEIVRANTAGFSDALRGGDSAVAEAFPPDAVRRPVRVSEIAAQLGLPHETTRRNLKPLIDDGRVVRVDQGYIVPAEVLARPRMASGWASNMRNMGRMLGDLSQTGVLALWDAEHRVNEAPIAATRGL